MMRLRKAFRKFPWTVVGTVSMALLQLLCGALLQFLGRSPPHDAETVKAFIDGDRMMIQNLGHVLRESLSFGASRTLSKSTATNTATSRSDASSGHLVLENRWTLFRNDVTDRSFATLFMRAGSRHLVGIHALCQQHYALDFDNRTFALYRALCRSRCFFSRSIDVHV